MEDVEISAVVVPSGSDRDQELSALFEVLDDVAALCPEFAELVWAVKAAFRAECALVEDDGAEVVLVPCDGEGVLIPND